MSHRSLVVISGFAISLLAVPLSAHHSYAAAYDMDATVVVAGNVTEVQWRNPHAAFGLDVTTEDGSVAHWNIELGPPFCLTQDGHDRNFLEPGERLTVSVAPAKDRANAAFARNVTFADGRSIELPVYEWMQDCR